MKEISYIIKSLLHAAGVFLYILAVVGLISNAKAIFGEHDTPLIPIFMLLLFILSATITSTLVLGRPIYLYLENRKKEAAVFLAATLAWLAVFLVVVAGVMVLLRYAS